LEEPKTPPADEPVKTEAVGSDIPDIPEDELHEGPRKWWTRQNALFVGFFALVILSVAGFYIQRGIVQGYEHRGDRYLDQKDYDRALKYFLKAARHDPQNPRVVFSVGKALLALGREHEALQAFRSSFRLGGANAELYLYMGFVENRIGRPYQAELFFTHALKIDRKLFAAHRELGMLRLKESDPAGAESHLSQAQKGYAFDKDPELYRILAETRMRLLLYEPAAETLTVVVKGSPGDAKAEEALRKARREIELEDLYRRIR
jgi:tetratricopeptide (TPR) repeat protein